MAAQKVKVYKVWRKVSPGAFRLIEGTLREVEGLLVSEHSISVATVQDARSVPTVPIEKAGAA